MNYTVKHRWVVPQNVVERCIKAVNENKVTIGVHKEDNGKHANRDRLGDEPAHAARYGGAMFPIGNAELLRKNEVVRSEEVFAYEGAGDNVLFPGLIKINVPSRPLLKPCVYDYYSDKKQYIINGIERQFKFVTPNAIAQSMGRFASTFNANKMPLRFVMNRGNGYWDDFAEHNGIYAQLIKYLDATRAYDADYDAVFDENGDFKVDIYDMFISMLPDGYDTPLLDSMDMVNSIKAKVEKR